MLKNTGAGSLRQEIPALSDHDPPIDLVHLARQSQGDPGLEQELLGLFAPLARSLALQLSDPQMRLELKANIAHKLRGSALAIGARRVAHAAEAIEATARSAGGEGPGEAETRAAALAIAGLQAAVAEAIAQIERLRLLNSPRP
jgi:HPt (histidine-containing phosphotransfer) domain-containing protein